MRTLDSTKERVSRVMRNFCLVSKMVDNRIGLFAIRSSYFIQFWTLIFEMFTLILTAITVYVAFLSIRK